MLFKTYLFVAALAASAIAAPEPARVRRGVVKRTASGDCNGTSCQVGFDNFECNVGSCVGPLGGDGSFCTVVDEQNGNTRTFCPGCGNRNLCEVRGN